MPSTSCFFKGSLCISTLLIQTEEETEQSKKDVQVGSELSLDLILNILECTLH